MNQKFLRYFLLVAVILVWALIVMKVFRSFPEDKAPALSTHPTPPAKEIVEQPDSFQLLLHYRDPFLPPDALYAADLQLVDTTPKPPPTPAPILSPEVIDVSFIKYLGTILHPQKKIRAAVLTINGREVVLKEKATAASITLQAIQPGSILILYKKKKFTILKSGSPATRPSS